MTAFDPEEIGQLLIIDCVSDALNVPTTKNQIVGESLILRCNVITGRYSGDLLNYTWSSNNTILRMANQTEQTLDHYFVSQLNASNDGQVYQCKVFVDTTPPVIGNGRITLNLTGRPSTELILHTLLIAMYIAMCVWTVRNIKYNMYTIALGCTFYSLNTGTIASSLPDIYTQRLRATGPRPKGVHIRQTMSTSYATIMQ